MDTDSPIEPQPSASIQVHLTFWQHPLVQDLLPLGTSVLLHLLVLVVGLLTWKTYEVFTTPVLREQMIIPESALVEGGPIGGIPNPGLGGDPNMSAAQNVDRTITVTDGWNDKRSETLTTTLMEGGAAPDAVDSVIGIGTRSGIAGSGDPGTGGQSGAGGPMAMFGVPGGGIGTGFKTEILGLGGNARKVVYICDASGSMMDVFNRVRLELRKALDILQPVQAFNVIFFADADVTALSKTNLLMATPDNKRKAITLSESFGAAGTTDPLPAIRMAFAQQPELIYVLTDGFENVVSFDSVINEFRRLNVDKKVKVNTILIRSTGFADLEKVMRQISTENGGRFLAIDRQSM